MVVLMSIPTEVIMVSSGPSNFKKTWKFAVKQ